MTQEEALAVLKSGKNVFLTGEPGAGKTHTVNQFKDWARSQYMKIAVTASTGIAATHINGKTIHSWASMGIKEDITDRDIENIMTKQYAVRQMIAADVLVIDEISMLSGKTLNNIDRILRHVRGTALTGEAFGGLQVILVGDFFQLPPVLKKSKITDFAFNSDAWKEADFTVCYLTEQHRQEDGQFLEVLTAMRAGTITPAHTRLLRATIGSAKGKKVTKLFTHNANVDILNNNELQKLATPAQTFVMKCEGLDFIVETLKKSCLSPERLTLKVGAQVMFTRNNFDQDTGHVIYVNGTQGTVVGFSGGMPVVETKAGNRIEAMYAEWSIDHNDGKSAAKIRQIPLRLAWALTVHKSQGMSLDAASMDLSGAFEYGQGYVALSRVRSLQGLSLEGLNAKALLMHPEVVKKDSEFRQLSEQVDISGTVSSEDIDPDDIPF